jgi:hypothetical protein
VNLLLETARVPYFSGLFQLYSSTCTVFPETELTQATWPAEPPVYTATDPGTGVELTLTPQLLAAEYQVLAFPNAQPLYLLVDEIPSLLLIRWATKDVHWHLKYLQGSTPPHCPL